MLLWKQFESGKQQLSVNLKSYHKAFNFRKDIHSDNSILSHLPEPEHLSKIIDIAASANARAHKAGFLKSKDFIKKGLLCCVDILQNYGYVPSSLPFLCKEIKPGSHKAILVPGCQIRDFLELRIGACASLLEETKMQANVLLSGRNPGQRVRLLNEARALETYLYLRKNCLGYITGIELDETASATPANINRFLSPDRQCPLSSTKVNDLFIVSSSFHLIALAKNLEQALNETNFKIGIVVLIGAEDPDTAFSKVPTISCDRYIKNLSFHIIEYLLLDQERYKEEIKASDKKKMALVTKTTD